MLGTWQAEYNSGIDRGRALAANAQLTERGKILQQIILRRDWDTLFQLIPLNKWPRSWSLSKYSFTGDGANKKYVAWTETDLQSFIFSPYYTIQPGYICSDEQRAMGVAAYMKAQARHKQKFGPTSYHYVWPIYPGGGYGSQTYGCEKSQESLWVKIRKPVVIAAAAVAAIYLGPIVYDKIGAVFSGGGAAAGKTAGIVGAGTKSGVVTAVTTKAGAAAAITAKAAPSLFSSVKATGDKILNYVNQGRTIQAIANGKMPPPPISIEGDSFREWATNFAIQEIMEKEQRKLSQQEQQMIDLEMRRVQQYLVQRIPSGIPAQPMPGVPIPVQQAMVGEKESNAETANLMTMGMIGLGVLMLAKGM